MPSELRYIMFTEKEIAEAAIGFLAGRAVLAPGSKNTKATVESMSSQSVVISFQKDEFGKRERRMLTSYEVIEALIGWCRHRAVMLPLSAKKSLIKIGPVLCMRTALQVPEKNVEQVERLILEAGAEASSQPAA